MNGALIRDARVVLGISLRDLASMLKVTPTLLGQVERNRKPAPPGWDEQLSRLVNGWDDAVRGCITGKYPKLAELARIGIGGGK